MKKHSVVLNGHATSVSIEDPFWRHLKRIAATRKISVQKMIAEVDDDRQMNGGPENLSSALRLLVLTDLE